MAARIRTTQLGAALAVYLANPTGDLDGSVDGIFVLDSTAYIRGALPWRYYVGHLLQHMYDTTGQRCAVVAQGSMSFVASSWEMSYQYVLQRIKEFFSAPKFMVRVSMGNDLYPPHRNMRVYEAPLREALQLLLRMATEYCSEQRFVFGGSSEVWQYSQYFSPEACSEYDRMCAMVRSCFHSQRGMYPGVSVINGDALLKGVVLTDRIGHISQLSMGQLRCFFRVLAKWGMAGCIGRSSL